MTRKKRRKPRNQVAKKKMSNCPIDMLKIPNWFVQSVAHPLVLKEGVTFVKIADGANANEEINGKVLTKQGCI